jgi:hypothetical protein
LARQQFLKTAKRFNVSFMKCNIVLGRLYKQPSQAPPKAKRLDAWGHLDILGMDCCDSYVYLCEECGL